MVGTFETGSDNERIDELEKRLDDVNDSLLFAKGGNENVRLDSTLGGRNAASGDAGGIRSNEPIIHQITDVDSDDVSTGFFDKINIISSMAIIDHTSSPITLKFIQGPVKNGSRIKITPKIGKTINVESGGDILTSATITIADTEYYELVKYSEAETGVSGGAWKIFKTGAGGGTGTVPDGTAENQHLEWNNTSGLWEAKDVLEFNPTGPHADDGVLRFKNDEIFAAGRTGADDGNIELKWTTNDELDFTVSNNTNVTLLMRAQHAADPDNLYLITNQPGSGGDVVHTFPNDLFFFAGAQAVLGMNSTRMLMALPISMDTNEVFLDNDEDSGIISTVDDTVQVFTNNVIRAAFQDTLFSIGTDVSMLTFDITQLDRLRFVADSGVVVSADDPSIFLDINSSMVFNLADQKQFAFKLNDEFKFVIDENGVNNDTLVSIQTNIGDASALPIFLLSRDDPTPQNDDEFSQINFQGTNAASSGGAKIDPHLYSRIAVEYENVVDGREAASMIFVTSFDTGAATQFTPFMVLNSANSGRVDMIRGLDCADNLYMNTNEILLDDDEDTGIFSATDDIIQFFTNNIIRMAVTNIDVQIGTHYLSMDDRADPSAPTGLSKGYYYVKDVAGVSKPFFIGDGQAAIDLSTGGGATSLNDLTDVTIATATDAQRLIYDGGAGLWKNQFPEGLDDLSFKVTDPQGGEFSSSEVWYSARVNTARRINDTGAVDDFFSNVSPGVDTVFFVPVVFGKKWTFNALAVHAVVGTGSTQLSIGFYESDPDTLEPTDLIVADNNFTLVAGDNIRSTGNISREAGVYYFAYKQETNPAPGSLKMRAIEPDAIATILGFENGEAGFTLGSTAVVGFIGDFTSTGLPTAFSSATNHAKITSATFTTFISGPPEVFARITSFGL